MRLKVFNGAPTKVAFDPATAKDGQTGVGIEFKATATGIPDTAKKVSFQWIYDHKAVDEDPFASPYDQPLASQSNHAFTDAGSHTVTVVLWDTTGSKAVALARASWQVEIIGPSESPRRNRALPRRGLEIPPKGTGSISKRRTSPIRRTPASRKAA